MLNGENFANSNSLQNLILNSINERVIFHDSQMRIRWINRAGMDFYKLPLEEIVGRHCQAILDRSQEECENCPVKKALETGNSGQAILSFPEGKTLLINAYPIFDDGKLIGAVEISFDITERTRKEKELLKIADESRAESEAKSRFLTNVSHEIRTLMNVILGMAELVYDSTQNEGHKEYLAMIRDSSSLLLSLVSDLLDLSKIESGTVKLEQGYFNLPQKVEKIVSSFRLQAQKKGLELNCTIGDNVPRTVVGDSGRLQQVLINLISNAIKYTEKGEINVSLQLDQAGRLENKPFELNEENKTVVLFSISDTGIGIPENSLSHIFQYYYQSDSYHHRSGREGAGLGLPITKNLVELMGGAMGVSSVVNRGSTFYFTIPFPVSRDEAASPGEPSGLKMEQEPDQAVAQGEKGLAILLVEDRPMNQKMTTVMLEKKGHRVTAAQNGKEALEILKSKRFDLIFMDIHMPEMDGFETTAHFRAAEKGIEHTPIIAMTAFATEKDKGQCLEAGMDNYISKPVTAPEIDRVIAEVRQPENRELHIREEADIQEGD